MKLSESSHELPSTLFWDRRMLTMALSTALANLDLII